MKNKIKSVINSCNTDEQLHLAHKYMLLAIRRKLLNSREIWELLCDLRERRSKILGLRSAARPLRPGV